jgi:hypothetical protein
MTKAPLGVVVVTVSLSGCLWEYGQQVDNRLARLQAGVNTRRVASPPPASTASSSGIARMSEPGSPAPSVERMSGAVGSVQFTMRQRHGIYAGAETEAGPVERMGFLSGAYAVIGAEMRSHLGSISVEMMGGRQWLRFGGDETAIGVLEPRARGQLSLSPQISVGGVIGAGLLNDAGWMAGIYIGVYSEPFTAPSR